MILWLLVNIRQYFIFHELFHCLFVLRKMLCHNSLSVPLFESLVLIFVKSLSYTLSDDVFIYTFSSFFVEDKIHGVDILLMPTV